MGKPEYTAGEIKVTVRMDPALVKRATLAANRETSFHGLIEQGLRRQLEAKA